VIVIMGDDTTCKAMPKTAAVIKSLVVLFLAFDGITKVLRVGPVMEACQKMGISPDMAVGIGLLLLVCAAIYVVPRTAILGAILLTGYLGGAAATHVLQHSGHSPRPLPSAPACWFGWDWRSGIRRSPAGCSSGSERNRL
jgi:hypothetical protein